MKYNHQLGSYIVLLVQMGKEGTSRISYQVLRVIYSNIVNTDHRSGSVVELVIKLII